jgi:hypothetical protein
MTPAQNWGLAHPMQHWQRYEKECMSSSNSVSLRFIQNFTPGWLYERNIRREEEILYMTTVSNSSQKWPINYGMETPTCRSARYGVSHRTKGKIDCRSGNLYPSRYKINSAQVFYMEMRRPLACSDLKASVRRPVLLSHRHGSQLSNRPWRSLMEGERDRSPI